MGSLVSAATDPSSTHHSPELECEPDIVPVRFLTITSAAVTVVVVAFIAAGVWIFDTVLAAELQAKGYDVTRSVPMQGSEAAP